MSGEKKSIWRRLLIVPPILIGIGIIAVMVRGKEPPAHTEAREDVTRVRVIEVPQLTLTPRALGFGTVAPAKVWAAVAEVDGKIIEFRDDLRAGEILPRERSCCASTPPTTGSPWTGPKPTFWR